MTILELLQMIFESKPPSWAGEFELWVRSSRRFRSFAETYRDKIRKKLRTAQDEAGLKDVFFELETAFRLLGDQRITLEYEKQGHLKQRAPDFTAAFRVNMAFQVEVTRLRMPEVIASEELERAVTRKLGDTVCDKLGQMLPSTINILLLVSELEISQAKLVAVMHELRLGAERKQGVFSAQGRFQDTRDFLHHLQRLSAIFCRYEGHTDYVLWQNSLARHPVPKDLLNALQKIEWS